ncbi:hypothetical protein CDD83_3189 [Cordyceps sp. RAO-2017]|nr:hypothetical protein CDD83_3189 [Cordyceps sp. RAO-2017]
MRRTSLRPLRRSSSDHRLGIASMAEHLRTHVSGASHASRPGPRPSQGCGSGHGRLSLRGRCDNLNCGPQGRADPAARSSALPRSSLESGLRRRTRDGNPLLLRNPRLGRSLSSPKLRVVRVCVFHRDGHAYAPSCFPDGSRRGRVEAEEQQDEPNGERRRTSRRAQRRPGPEVPRAARRRPLAPCPGVTHPVPGRPSGVHEEAPNAEPANPRSEAAPPDPISRPSTPSSSTLTTQQPAPSIKDIAFQLGGRASLSKPLTPFSIVSS